MLFALVVGTPSCSQDEPDKNVSGQISFYGETYDLEQGALYHDNNYTVISLKDYTFEDKHSGRTDHVKGFTADVRDKETGNFMLCLYEHGFVLSDLTQDARGEGACICLRMASPQADALAPGKYTYSLDRDDFTFRGVSSVKYNSESGCTPNQLTGGEVEVAVEGETYTLSFKCVTSTGGTVEGTFKGQLKTFDIRKNVETVFSYENISLMALLDKVEYVADGKTQSEPDYQRGAAFFNTANRSSYTANTYKGLSDADKKAIDLALAYDAAANAVYFESPIKMRALLWHNTFQAPALQGFSFDLPCHTRYMAAPQGFGNAQFENLQVDDFNFTFTEGKVSIPVGSTAPAFVFVQTGNGQRVILRIKQVSPKGSQMIGGITYPVNPTIVMDMKCPKNFTEQQMR